jgi:hypothetical protein
LYARMETIEIEGEGYETFMGAIYAAAILKPYKRRKITESTRRLLKLPGCFE